MRLTALYKAVGDIAVIAICTKEDWRSCEEHKDCSPAAVSLPLKTRTVKEVEPLENLETHHLASKRISAVSLKTGDFY